jgi:Ca-activated chloride channel family protein
MKIKVFLFLGMMMTFCMLSAVNQENEEDKTLSPYFVVLSENPGVDNLPLKETSVKADITGVIADVTINQVYINEGKNTLEAIYTFPMSTKAAVYGMKMTVGMRIITAKIEEKEKARSDYEKAKSEGKRASLLEQSRPNVFTMNVSNIAVNDTIVIELKYTELLVPEKGKYSFVYPTVVGPRYSTKSSKNAGLNDEFVAAPYTKSGEMPAYNFDFELNINSGIPIQDVTCNTHKMLITHSATNQVLVKLDPVETKGGNRDVIVDYSLQGSRVESGMMLYEGEDENFFLMMVQPPRKVLKENIPPREYIFIVDVSGSMHGFPLDISKKLLRNLILNLDPDDKFNVLLFSGTSALMSNNSLNAGQENIEKAIRFIDKQQGGGGTELLEALESAYLIPRPDPDLSRTFVVVTDGYIDVEKEAFELIRKNNGNTNFFAFGIGSDVNRYLIEGMAFIGNGEPMIITQPGEAEKQAEQFRNYINTPVLTRIKANFGAFEAYDVEPLSVPDMLAERPIVIFGKYKGKPAGTVTLSGKTGRKAYKQSFDLSALQPNPDYSALRYLWARERIKYLDYMTSNSYSHSDEQANDDAVKKITGLGLKYNLMTNYTSFIAIDEQLVMQDGKLVTVKQPLPLPEGVSDYAVGYEAGEIGGGISERLYEEIDAVEIMDPEDDKETIFQHVEQMPQFPGGDRAMMEFIVRNMVYPPEMAQQGIQGRVILRFVVEADGSISEIEVIKGINSLLDEEAVRVVKLMPKWIPGKLNGQPVRIYYSLPVVFKLSQSEK